MKRFITTYGKTIVACVGAAAYALQAALTDGAVTGVEWFGIVAAVAVAAGVWKAPAITKASQRANPPG